MVQMMISLTHMNAIKLFMLVQIRWQKRIFLHLNLQDEMNRSFIAQNSYRLEREIFSKIYRSCRRILSSTFQLIFQEHKLRLGAFFHCISKFPSIYIQLFWNTLTRDAKTGELSNLMKNDLALELGKSISLTKVEEEAVAREVHATHARIMFESEPEPTQRRQSEFDGRTKCSRSTTDKNR
ncbi:hypothetical protein Tco_1336329 [Tanacetum coccineum]